MNEYINKANEILEKDETYNCPQLPGVFLLSQPGPPRTGNHQQGPKIARFTIQEAYSAGAPFQKGQRGRRPGWGSQTKLGAGAASVPPL